MWAFYLKKLKLNVNNDLKNEMKITKIRESWERKHIRIVVEMVGQMFSMNPAKHWNHAAQNYDWKKSQEFYQNSILTSHSLKNCSVKWFKQRRCSWPKWTSNRPVSNVNTDLGKYSGPLWVHHCDAIVKLRVEGPIKDSGVCFR